MSDAPNRASEAADRIARKLGARAGRTFVQTGISPRCPFRAEGDTRALAMAWHDAYTKATAALRPKGHRP